MNGAPIVRVRKLAIAPDPQAVFIAQFERAPLSFWLDSSRARPGHARFSFMGAGAGPHAALVSYDASEGTVTERRGGTVQRFETSIYAYLHRETRRLRCENPDLPFSFNCGFVGYFGYELKVETGASHRHRADHPDAMFLFADRLVVFDHQEETTYILCLAALDEETEADAWLDFMERALGETSVCERAWVPDLHPIVFTLSRPRARYLEDIARCKRHIRDGDTYEVCLTNRIHTAPVPDPLGVYLALRRINPAPHAAYLDFGEVVVMSSSPERFLAIDRERWIESKPIKGTRPRGRTDDEDRALREQLGEDEKDRSENLMIVDLVRNDLGAVCEVGTVHVPALMQVESYETVHHLVSTIRGRLRPGLGAIDAIVSAFPGGSMTGAPKLRTMDIIDGLEDEPRGVYAGALGFLGLGGTADLSIVIRTVVQTPTSTTIGMGGAVVSLSDPETEFEETMVKARPLVHAIVLASHGTVAPAALDAGMQQLRETGATRF